MPNGLIIQWGYTSFNNDTTTTVSFPTSFTTASSTVVSGGRASTGQQDNGPYVTSSGTSSFQTYSSIDAGTTTYGYWIAVGY
jgi:hypothetical protein